MGDEDSLKIKDICPFLFKTLAIHLILIIDYLIISIIRASTL